MVEVIVELLGYAFSYFVTPRRRLEKNVELLKKEPWFAELEDDFRYNHIIWNNGKVIRYLALNSHIDKLLKDDDEKEKFKKMVTYEHIKFITAR